MRRSRVRDFIPDPGTLEIRYSKTDRAADKAGRSIRLDDEGTQFFRGMTAGRNRDEIMFRQSNGEPWKADNQFLLKKFYKRANLGRHISMGIFSHTWACNAAMSGMSPWAIAEKLGHTTVPMVIKYYVSRLSEDWLQTETRDRAPKFGFAERNNKVVAMV